MMSVRNIWFFLILCTMLLSCAGEEDVLDAGEQNNLNLVLSVGKANSATRMNLDVVQDEGQSFRGLQRLELFPFITNGRAVIVDDEPDIPLGGESSKVNNKNYYYWGNCMMTRGTDRVLVWGQAAPVTGKSAPEENGKLETTLDERMLLKDITFSLSSIQGSITPHDDAKALATYMTTIANTSGWSTTDDAQMKALYLNFINADPEKTGLMAGSAAHVKAYVETLKKQLETLRNASGTNDNIKTLCGEIINNIGDTETTTSCVKNGYPGSIGLPDGAAVLRWTKDDTGGEYKFMVRTETTTLDNINNITRYTYPAELWYYVNSAIYTSDENVEKTTYESATTWSSLLIDNYKGSHYVNAETKAVAVEAPMQYGVGRLQMTLDAIPVTLKDSKEENIYNQDDQHLSLNMPLTAVIIGGQHTVGFDFQPKGEQSDVDVRFIYDKEVGSKSLDGKWTVNTLVLQTYDNEIVPIVLEFENKTGNEFTGKDGIIYPNTKFYLIAQIDPSSVTDPENKPTDYDDIKKRVFTQDHTTKMTMKVTSLANAYSCLPDLLSPRLEIGVQIVTQWIQSTPTSVIL